jgi:UDP-3-O-[3-hydroxymyristoyl] glucosamine N-acyltransferase
MSAVPITEIVALVGGRYDGPRNRTIRGVAALSEAADDELSFLGNPQYAPQVAASRAGAILVPNETAGDDRRFIRVSQPYAALADVIGRWFDVSPRPEGISPLASISPKATLGANVAVGPFTSIGDGVAIGEGTILHANVTIYAGCKIGKRCVLHSGVVIGSDGYGFVNVDGKHKKIPQIGIVRIEDDVEIGANSTVDRAALGETVIGEGTKIDNLVQVGHNVRIGKHCLLVSQVGIAGSTELGDYVVAAGQAGVSGHLKIGPRAQIGGASAVFQDVPAGTKVVGNPALPFREYARRDMMLKRLLAKKRK